MTIKPKVKSRYSKILDMTLFVGFITVYHNGKYLYSKFCNVTRLNKEDAKLDACELLADIQLHNRS